MHVHVDLVVCFNEGVFADSELTTEVVIVVMLDFSLISNCRSVVERSSSEATVGAVVSMPTVFQVKNNMNYRTLIAAIQNYRNELYTDN